MASTSSKAATCVDKRHFTEDHPYDNRAAVCLAGRRYRTDYRRSYHGQFYIAVFGCCRRDRRYRTVHGYAQYWRASLLLICRAIGGVAAGGALADA